MKVGGIDAAVEVTSDPTLINESATVSTIVDQQFVKDMPLNGRSFQSLLLTPGTEYSRPANKGS
ncbi:MAG: hypothetical protein IPO41_03625 [Acidobacteria bacterium]|nr:hypothetical protein [Acidobacteriota bacterium]